MTSRRVRTALLRLAAPFRRRHPVVLATVERVTIRSGYMANTGDNATVTGPDNWRDSEYYHLTPGPYPEEGGIDPYYRAERDPAPDFGQQYAAKGHVPRSTEKRALAGRPLERDPSDEAGA